LTKTNSWTAKTSFRDKLAQSTRRAALGLLAATGAGTAGGDRRRDLLWLILVEDERAGNLGLPQAYGVDDIPLVLQNRRFGDDGTFEYRTSMRDGDDGPVHRCRMNRIKAPE